MQDVKDTTDSRASNKPGGGKQQEQQGAPQQPPPNPGPSRQQAMPYGIVGAGMKEVTRRVPQDEPPPLPENAKLKSIGKPVSRLDGIEKVTGRARYTFDVQLPGMLWGKWVASTLPHARIKSIDTSAAERYPGVRAIHIQERLLSSAQLRDPKAEQNTRYPTVRYAGQPIAAVAADSPRAAEAAAKLGAKGAGTAAKAAGRFAPGLNVGIAAIDTAIAAKTIADPKASVASKVTSGITAAGSIVAATNIPIVSQVGAAVSTASTVAGAVVENFGAIKEGAKKAAEGVKNFFSGW